MKYIDDKFLEALKRFRHHRLVPPILSRIDNYRKTFRTEFARALKYEIHIIGMRHAAGIEIDLQTVTSQSDTVANLKRISPDIVGMEGVAKEKYSLNAIMEHAELLIGRKLTKKEWDLMESDTRTNPQKTPMFNYYEQNPHILFVGIENLPLQTLETYAYLQYMEARKNENDVKKMVEMAILNEGASRLRGLLMVAKLTRLMKNFKKTRAALPVGALHLREISELKTHLGANWKIIDTSNFFDTDLPK